MPWKSLLFQCTLLTLAFSTLLTGCATGGDSPRQAASPASGPTYMARAQPSQEVPPLLKTAKDDNLGTILVGPNGRTLYVFDNDKESGKSTCSGQCAENWPPLTPQAGDPEPVAPLSVITRDDGSKQYAYKGKPLLLY